MATTIRIAVTMNIRAGEAFEIAQGLAQGNLPDGSEIIVSYGLDNSRLGGFEAPRLLAAGEADLAFLNPSPVTYMALNGLAPYTEKIDIRNLAVFPSWDKIAFAVRRDLGVRSLEEIGEKKLPLRLSTRGQGPEGTTEFTLRRVLSLCGWNLEDMEQWGGSVDKVPVPSHPRRMQGIEQNAYDAVFDEGITGWTADALSRDMVLLPLRPSVFAAMEQLGFRESTIPRSVFPALDADVPALEFGGWPFFCRADFPDELAYAVVKAIAARKDTMPVDGERFDMSRICRNTEEGPMCAPLHPGAERYYREEGYL